MRFSRLFYWSSAFKVCTGYLPKYEWNLHKIGFKNTYFQVFFRDFQLFQHPVKLAKFRPNLGQFWPKRTIFKFPPKSENVSIFRLQRLCFEQKIRKFRCAVLEKNAKTLHFWSFRPKRAILDSFWPKWPKR